MKNSKGFLLISAVIIVVLFALMSSLLVSMFVRVNVVSTNLGAIPKASALAESGTEAANVMLTQNVLTSRASCASVNETLSVGGGTYLATKTANSPYLSVSTLVGTIASTGTPSSITVANASVFEPKGGRVLIGKEVFAYQSASGTTLTGITRGIDGSILQSHPDSALVSQYQCTTTSLGTWPSTATRALRTYQQGLQQPLLFTVGDTGFILRWNNSSSELTWDNPASGTTQNINSVSAINYHDAWAVADSPSGNDIFTFVRLQQSTWSTVTVTMNNLAASLRGVDAVSESEAWAVGDRLPGNLLNILRWTRNASNLSTNWCELTATTSGCGGHYINKGAITNNQAFLKTVKTLDTNGDGLAELGVAGGGQSGTAGGTANRGIVMSYNGTVWSNVVIPANNSIGELYGAAMVSAQESFYVGRSASSSQSTLGKFIRLKSDGTWIFNTINNILYDVAVIDTNGDGYTDFGCAVGDGGRYVFFSSNAGGVTINTDNTLAGAPNLRSVYIINKNDVWAVGENGGRYHWDGSNWVTSTTGVTTAKTFYSLAGVHPVISPISMWSDVIG